jgi:hypothetical protein
MVVDLNGFKLSGNKKLRGDSEEDICRGETYEGQKLVLITFAAHDPSKKYNWTTDTEDGRPDVESVEVVCSNCGITYDIPDGEVKFDPNTWTWKYIDDGKVVSEYSTKSGYALDEDSPYFETKMGEVVYEDGLPVVKADVIRKSDKVTVEPKDILVEKANDYDLGRIGKRVVLMEDRKVIKECRKAYDKAEKDIKDLQDIIDAANLEKEALDAEIKAYNYMNTALSEENEAAKVKDAASAALKTATEEDETAKAALDEACKDETGTIQDPDVALEAANDAIEEVDR